MMLMRSSAERPDSRFLCTSVTPTKAEQLRVYFSLTLPLVQMKSKSNRESGRAFSELLKRELKNTQKQNYLMDNDT